MSKGEITISEVRCKGCGRKRECRYGYCFECATWGEQRALSAKVAERMGRPDIAAAILKAAPR